MVGPPLAPIEPRLDLSEALRLLQQRPLLMAALRRWMLMHKLDPTGHYTLQEWRGFLATTLAHT